MHALPHLRRKWLRLISLSKAASHKLLDSQVLRDTAAGFSGRFFSPRFPLVSIYLTTLWRPNDTIKGRCISLYDFLIESISSTYCSFIISRHRPGPCEEDIKSPFSDLAFIFFVYKYLK